MNYEKNVDIELVGSIHKMSTQYREAEKTALRVIQRAFAISENRYVSLSGGKDSIAMVPLIERVAIDTGKDYILWSHVSDASYPGTMETIKRCAALVNRKLILNESPVSAFDVCGKQSKIKFGKKGYFFDAIADFSKDYDLVFTGTRSAESKRRAEAFKFNGHIFDTTVPSPITRCDPIAHFTIEDVAACLIKYGYPIHPIYKKRAISNLPLRLGYITALDLLDKDTAIFIKTNYPHEFIKLAKAYPDVRRYI